MPQHNSNVYAAARGQAAWLERADRGLIVISGKDRVSYLHALLTNDITTLHPGHGVYSAYLTPQGRMISDMWVFELGDVMLMTLPRATKDAVLAKLDQFLFSEDVQLGDVTETFAAVDILGPTSANVVAGMLDSGAKATIDALPLHGAGRAAFRTHPAIVVRVDDLGEPGYELLIPAADKPALIDALGRSAVAALDADTADALRIESGTPKFGADMDEETIPLEAGIESRAISLTKGCYVGQEVIVRVLHRGHGRVVRKLAGLLLEGTVPPAGAVVQADSRDVGRVTSGAWSPSLQRPIALAYLHRDFLEPGTSVTIDGRPGRVAALPFVARAA